MGMKTARSRGFDISYDDVGSGPAVVLVNGYASPAAEWTEVGYTALLVERYRVLAVDSLGHGQSQKSYEPDDYTLPDAAVDVIAAMDDAGVERAALWGYSRGAKLVATAAAESSERLSALILGGFTPPSGTRSDEIDPSTEALLRGDWEAYWQLELLDGPISDEDRLYMQDSSDPRAMAAVELGRARSDYEIDASRISAPTFLYYGSDDAPDAELAESLKPFGAPYILGGQHDHFTAFSDVDSVAPIVLAFLDRVART
jgi:pimeloyl-ACP methyl ester carboxylesterase